MKKIFTFLSILILCFHYSYSQEEIVTDQTDKAQVYFVRVSKYATHATYYILKEDSVININEGINWFKYECEPGKHLFWITNRKYYDFMQADLQAGKSYVVMIDVRIGYGKTSVRFDPLEVDNKVLPRALQLIKDEEEVQTMGEDLFYKTKSLNKRDIIQETLDNYNKDWKFSRKYFELGDENIIPNSQIREYLLLQ